MRSEERERRGVHASDFSFPEGREKDRVPAVCSCVCVRPLAAPLALVLMASSVETRPPCFPPFPLCAVSVRSCTVLCVWSCVGVVLCVGGAGAACLSACGASLSTLEAHRAQHC